MINERQCVRLENYLLGHVLGGVRTLYSGSEERFVHLLLRHAEEILNSAWSFRVEFPHAEGPAFARLDSTN